MSKKQFTDVSGLKAFETTKKQKTTTDIAIFSSIYILKELKDFIEPLTEEEYETLETSILKEGVRDSIILWKTEKGYAIVDGHNRFGICQKHNITNFPYTIKEFADIDEVMLYMIAIQLGRRNISNLQRKYLLGMKYELNKVKGGNQYSTLEEEIDPNITDPKEIKRLKYELNKNRPVSTSLLKEIAKEENIGTKTVERAAETYNNVNIISDFVDKSDEENSYKTNILTDKKIVIKDINEIASRIELISNSKDLAKIEQAKLAIKESDNSKQTVTRLKELTKDLEPQPVEIKEPIKVIDTINYEYSFSDKLSTLKEFQKRGLKRTDNRVKSIEKELRSLVDEVLSLFPN